ncbi:MAG: LegC family aminotransferase [Acidobacteria bacterium]|nr:MAG: LegC family aminotransferase [Acidobacteriota bacterium]
MSSPSLPSAKFVPLSEPVIAGNEWAYVKECLDTGWVSSVGAFVDRFEKATADYAGAAHAVAVVNGTAAIHVGLLVAGVEPGDEVIVSDLTFAAPANAIRYASAFPVFMDARPDTWQMDAAKLERFLTSECDRTASGCINRRSGRRVKAIVPVHILGLACEIDRIVALAGDYGLAVIEDATEAVGVRYQGKHLGTFGDVGTFSFNGNKVITTGGGGMVVTNDAALAARVRYLTTQAKDDPIEYVHHAIGYNYRLTNVLAAIGVAQLEQLGGFIARKRDIAARYDAAIAGAAGLTPMPRQSGVVTNHWLYTTLLRPGTSLESRKAVVKQMNALGIGVRPLWHTIHDLPPFADCQAFEIEHSVALYHRAMSLPSGAGLSDDDVSRTIAALGDVVSGLR